MNRETKICLGIASGYLGVNIIGGIAYFIHEKHKKKQEEKKRNEALDSLTKAWHDEDVANTPIMDVMLQDIAETN